LRIIQARWAVKSPPGRPIGEDAGDQPQNGSDAQADLREQLPGPHRDRDRRHRRRQYPGEEVNAAERPVNPLSRPYFRQELQRAEHQRHRRGENVRHQYGVLQVVAYVDPAAGRVEARVRIHEHHRENDRDDR
jgi:hypothetical protein